MVYVTCLMLSLSLLCCITLSSSGGLFTLQDGLAQRETAIIAFEGKVKCIASGADADLIAGIRRGRSFDRTIVLSIASKISSTKKITIIDKPSVCNSKIRSGGASKKKRKPRKHARTHRLLLCDRGAEDMDEFVAYADDRGPQRHPPRNNGAIIFKLKECSHQLINN